jgi:hypothetical protein
MLTWTDRNNENWYLPTYKEDLSKDVKNLKYYCVVILHYQASENKT